MPNPAIATGRARVVFTDAIAGNPCDPTAPVVLGKASDLMPILYPDLKKEFSEVRSGYFFGNKLLFSL